MYTHNGPLLTPSQVETASGSSNGTIRLANSNTTLPAYSLESAEGARWEEDLRALNAGFTTLHPNVPALRRPRAAVPVHTHERSRAYRERKQRRLDDPSQVYRDRLIKLLASEDDSVTSFPTGLLDLHANTWVRKFLLDLGTRTTEAVCCVCQELVALADTSRLDALPNLELLRAPASAPAADVVNGYYLERRGMTETDGRTQYTCCKDCYASLASKRLPAVAIANGLSFGAVPPALMGLTVVERILISPICAKVNLLILKAVAGPGSGQRAIKGHINAYPRDIVALNDALLPLDLSVLREQIHVVLSRTSRPSAEELKRVLTCRQARVRDAIVCLVTMRSDSTSPSVYSRCQLDPARLAQLPEDAVPEEVLSGITEMDDADDHAAHAGYTPGLNEVSPTADTDILDASAHLDHIGSSVPQSVTSATAFQRVIDPSQDTPVEHRAHVLPHPNTGEPILIAPHRPAPVQQWNDAAYFIDAFSHLFPNGQGSPLADRPVKLTLKRWVQHCIRHVDPRWRKDVAFIFVSMNVLLRNEAALNVFVHMRPHHFHEFERRFGNITAAMLEAAARVKANPHAVVDVGIRDAVAFLADKTNLVQANLPFTNANKMRRRREMFSLMVFHGFPVIWVTLNPADLHSPVVLRLARQDENLAEAFANIDSGQQARIIASNPYRPTQYFHHLCDAFFANLVHTLGNVKAYYGMVEAQGRGSLHIHILVWMKGYWTVTQLTERLHDPAFRQQMKQYAESVVCTSIPDEPAQPAEASMDVDGARAPVVPEPVVASATLHREDPRDPSSLTEAELQAHHRQLIKKSLMHDTRHTPSCRKRNSTECRFGFPFPLAPETVLSDAGELTLRRNHAFLTAHNPAIAYAINANTHIMLLALQRSSRTLPYYMTMYATKKTDLAHDWLAIAAEAMQRVEAAAADAANPLPEERRGRSLLSRLCMATLRTLQVAAPEALTYLMDFKDHYTSHTYTTVPIQVFVRWVNRSYEHLRTAPLHPETHNDDGTSDAPPPGLDTEDPDDEALLVHETGRVVLQANAVNDYVYRPGELADLCLYDMVAAITVDSAPATAAEGAAEPFRLDFLPAHPSAGHKICRIKRVLTVPDLPYLPKNAVAAPEDHALYMLLLFKPFRAVADLKLPTETWTDAWGAAKLALSARLQQIVANLHELELGKVDVAKQAEERRADPEREDDPEHAAYQERDGADDEGNDGAQPQAPRVLTNHGRIAYHLSMLRLDEAFQSEDAFLASAIAAASSSGRFDAPPPPPELTQLELQERVHRAAAAFTLTIDRQGTAAVHGWKQLLKARKHDVEIAVARQERFDFGTEGAPALERIDPLASLDDATAGPAAPEHREVTVMDVLGADGVATLDSFVAQRDPKLNAMQEIAVRVVARHAIHTFRHVAECERNGQPVDHQTVHMPAAAKQLLMFLSGQGGTGKSLVIRALIDFFSVLGRKAALQVCATTNAAALLVNGKTAHSFASIPVETNATETTTVKLQHSVAKVWYVILDEVSMMGCATFCRMHQNLCRAKSTPDGVVFGHINLIAAGDFMQLPPVKDPPLYASPDPTHETPQSTGAKERMRLVQGGRLAWLSFNASITLTQVMRQPDPRYRKLLNNLRAQGDISDTDFALLQSRILERLPQPERLRFRDATLITARNVIRHQIGLRTLYCRAQERHQRVLLLFAEDLPLVPIDNLPVQTRDFFLALPDGDTKGLPGALVLVLGEDYVLNTTPYAPIGAVNNASGRLVRIIPDGREPAIDMTDVARPYVFRYMPHALVLRLEHPTVPFSLPGLGENEFPCTPKALTVQLPLKRNARSKGDKLAVQRTMFALAPANAVTGHRAQGRTMDCMVGDLAAPKRGHAPAFVYTMLSRGRTLDGLAILRNFTRADLRTPSNPQLVRDQARLDRLQQALLTSYATDDPIDRVDLRQCFPPDYELPMRRGGQSGAPTGLGPNLHVHHLQSVAAQMGDT